MYVFRPILHTLLSTNHSSWLCLYDTTASLYRYTNKHTYKFTYACEYLNNTICLYVCADMLFSGSTSHACPRYGSRNVCKILYGDICMSATSFFIAKKSVTTCRCFLFVSPRITWMRSFWHLGSRAPFWRQKK